MKRVLLFFSFFFYLLNCFSQNNRHNIWYFGFHAGLDFNTNPPTALSNSAMYQTEGSATMCDNNGQLLFYSSGIIIWNRNHQVMLNGTGLLGGSSSTQSALIVPKPTDNNIYYVFTVPNIGGTVPLSYSIVDMTLDGGLGAVTIKNSPLNSPVGEKLTATLKSNGVDYWIVAKEMGSDVFFVYSLTSAGVDPVPVISHGGLVTEGVDAAGYIRFSPNGSKFCAAFAYSQLSQVFDFDNSTGLLSNPINLPSPAVIPHRGPYGVEFSPDNSKLYIMPEKDNILWQYDLLAGSPIAIQNSAVQIAEMIYPEQAYALALGRDGKIYLAQWHKPLSVINNPNLAGTACNFMYQVVPVAAGTNCELGLPNNINYAFYSCAAAVNVTNNITVCANQTYQLPSGTIVNTAGIYADTIRNLAATCDSIIYTINLSVYNVSLLNTSVHICANQTYQLPSGTIVSAEGIYSDTLTNIAGCDSVINTIHLFVDNVSLQNTDAHICPGQTFTLPSGTTVNAAGIYLDTLRSQASCDSIINTIHLFIDHAVLQNIEAHICPNQAYMLPSGIIVSAEGIYVDTLRSQASCDSIINTIQLWIDDVSLQNTEAQICSNQHYQLPSGTMVNNSGIYIDTLRSQAQCDSIINTIHLVVNDLSFTNQVDSIFAGQNYTLPSGVIVSAPGTYQSVLTNSLGCDSVITTTLILRKTIAECITLKNAITPNGDGINDYWVLYRYLCFKKLEVSVYNRYGSLVYRSRDYKNDWNGKYNNQELPDGTYYYVIKVFAYDGKLHVFKDNVTILR